MKGTSFHSAGYICMLPNISTYLIGYGYIYMSPNISNTQSGINGIGVAKEISNIQLTRAPRKCKTIQKD